MAEHGPPSFLWTNDTLMLCLVSLVEYILFTGSMQLPRFCFLIKTLLIKQCPLVLKGNFQSEGQASGVRVPYPQPFVSTEEMSALLTPLIISVLLATSSAGMTLHPFVRSTRCF
jgi:hypothetical protein